MVHVIKHLNDYVSEIRRQFQQELEPSAPKLYVKELETELAVAENTIHKTEESFQILRNNYHNLQEYVSILQDILTKNETSFPELYG
jgi:hypothetical protein